MNNRDPYNFDNNKNPLAENLLKSYANTESLQDYLNKAEEAELEKGGKKAFIGEKREFGGRMYIKTTQGWKFFGKGTGTKAKDHHEKHAPSTAKTDEEYDKERNDFQEKIERVKKKEVTSTPVGEPLSEYTLAELEGMKITATSIGDVALKNGHIDAAGKQMKLLHDINEEIAKRASTAHPFKEGDKVRIDQKGAKLMSLSPFEGKDLSVEKIIDTGLISEPFQAKVTDGEGSSIIVSMNDLKKVSDEVAFTPKQLKDAAKSVLGALSNVSRKSIDIPHSKSFNGKAKDGRGYYLSFHGKEPDLEIKAADFSRDEDYVEQAKKTTRIKGKEDISTFLTENPAILRDIAQSIVHTVEEAAEKKKAPWGERMAGGMSKHRYYSDLYNGFFGKATLNIEHLKEIL